MEVSINQSVTFFIVFHLPGYCVYLHVCRQITLNHCKLPCLYVYFTILKFVVKYFKCNQNVKFCFVIDCSDYYCPFNQTFSF